MTKIMEGIQMLLDLILGLTGQIQGIHLSNPLYITIIYISLDLTLSDMEAAYFYWRLTYPVLF